jgi:pilus assembly protein CpaE
MSSRDIFVRIKANTVTVGRVLEKIVSSIEGFRVQTPTDGRRSDLLILEVGDDVEKEIQVISSLAASNLAGEIFLTSRKPEPTLLVRAMQLGTREFFTQPLEEKAVAEALERFKGRVEASGTRRPVKLGRIVNVVGSKGGVGTTTLAVNLAVSSAENKGAGSVALLDMNMAFGEVPLFLGIKPGYTWGQVAKNISRLDSTFLLSTTFKHDSGVHVLPSPGSLNGHSAPTPEVIQRVLALMKNTFHFIVIDGGQSFDATSLKTAPICDSILLVSQLNLPCLSNTKNLLKALSDAGIGSGDRVKLVINRHLRGADMSVKEAEQIIGKEVFWVVPNDYKTTMSAINQGKALREISNKAAVTKSVEDLALALLGQEVPEEKRRWRVFRQ